MLVIERKGKYKRVWWKEAGWEREHRGFRSAREEEEEDRCTRLCSTDVETSQVSVEGKRKFAHKQVGLAAAYAQLSPHIALLVFQKSYKDATFKLTSFQHLTFNTLVHTAWASLT